MHLIPQVSISPLFITDAYYVLTAPNNTDPCDEMIITVSGYNGAGNGEMTSISSYFPKGINNVYIYMNLYVVCDYWFVNYDNNNNNVEYKITAL